MGEPTDPFTPFTPPKSAAAPPRTPREGPRGPEASDTGLISLSPGSGRGRGCWGDLCKTEQPQDPVPGGPGGAEQGAALTTGPQPCMPPRPGHRSGPGLLGRLNEEQPSDFCAPAARSQRPPLPLLGLRVLGRARTAAFPLDPFQGSEPSGGRHCTRNQLPPFGPRPLNTALSNAPEIVPAPQARGHESPGT